MKENNENISSKEQFEADLASFAMKYSLTRVKAESLNYVRDYARDNKGQLRLVTERAVIRALGKVSRVPIGENEKYKTFEEAEIGVRAFWSAYFKKRREQRSDKERRAEAARQKRYRERRKELIIEKNRAQN